MAWRPADLPDGKPMSSFTRRQRLCSIDRSKDKALAQQFIEFINQPQYVKARYVATGEIPPLKAIDDPVIKTTKGQRPSPSSRASGSDAGHSRDGDGVGAGQRRA